MKMKTIDLDALHNIIRKFDDISDAVDSVISAMEGINEDLEHMENNLRIMVPYAIRGAEADLYGMLQGKSEETHPELKDFIDRLHIIQNDLEEMEELREPKTKMNEEEEHGEN
jgi:hypothetical protein